MNDAIRSRPLEPFGAELDIDLRRGLSADQQGALRELFARHDLLLVRGEPMTMDQQITVCEVLGPVLMSDSGEMSRDTVIGLAGVELCFHSDYGYSPEPLQAISLHAIDVVDGETSTRFASGRRAYEHLDSDVRAHADLARSLQVFGARLDRRNRRSELDPVLPDTIHPLVWPHDGTGGRFIFAPEMTTDSIVGATPEESETLLSAVFAAMCGPGDILEHRWSLGDFVVWNNTSVVHARGDVSAVDRRVLQRVTIGTKGYLDLYPELAGYEWDEGGSMVEGTAFSS